MPPPRCVVYGDNMKFLHSADWQLGKPYGRFEPDLRSALTEARFDAIDALGRAAVEHGEVVELHFSCSR